MPEMGVQGYSTDIGPASGRAGAYRRTATAAV